MTSSPGPSPRPSVPNQNRCGTGSSGRGCLPAGRKCWQTASHACEPRSSTHAIAPTPAGVRTDTVDPGNFPTASMGDESVIHQLLEIELVAGGVTVARKEGLPVGAEGQRLDGRIELPR